MLREWIAAGSFIWLRNVRGKAQSALRVSVCLMVLMGGLLMSSCSWRPAFLTSPSSQCQQSAPADTSGCFSGTQTVGQDWLTRLQNTGKWFLSPLQSGGAKELSW